MICDAFGEKGPQPSKATLSLRAWDKCTDMSKKRQMIGCVIPHCSVVSYNTVSRNLSLDFFDISVVRLFLTLGMTALWGRMIEVSHGAEADRAGAL